MSQIHPNISPAVIGERLLDQLENQHWLDKPGFKLEHAVALVTNLLGDAARPVTNMLHGTWLGHPLHALMTDVPVGAWTTALVLDAVEIVGPAPQPGYEKAARRSVGVGLVGAGIAALAGLADWQYTQDNARRTGVAHATLNVAAVGCYTGSWFSRGRGRYRQGRLAGVAGYALVMASGYLGGSLVSRHRVGVDHADRRLLPRQFADALPESQLHERQPVKVTVEGMSVLLVRSAGRIYALGQECSHLGGPLDRGWLLGDTVVCPWHGSAFELATGRVWRGPATCQQPTFETRVRDGQIQVRCQPSSPEAPPGSVVAGEQRQEGSSHVGH